MTRTYTRQPKAHKKFTMPLLSTDLVKPIKYLASEMIELALKDLEVPETTNFFDAKRWVEANSRKFGGYCWCIGKAEINPNIVRKAINILLGGGTLRDVKEHFGVRDPNAAFKRKKMKF